MTENQAVCPVCEEYSGKPASVEAHITGKSDDRHRGKFGAEYRERIRSQSGDVTEIEDGDETGESSTGRLVAEESSDLGDSERSSVPAQDRSESDNSGWLALLVAGAVALVIWVTGRGNSTEEPSPESDTGPETGRHS